MAAHDCPWRPIAEVWQLNLRRLMGSTDVIPSVATHFSSSASVLLGFGLLPKKPPRNGLLYTGREILLAPLEIWISESLWKSVEIHYISANITPLKKFSGYRPWKNSVPSTTEKIQWLAPLNFLRGARHWIICRGDNHWIFSVVLYWRKFSEFPLILRDFYWFKFEWANFDRDV